MLVKLSVAFVSKALNWVGVRSPYVTRRNVLSIGAPGGCRPAANIVLKPQTRVGGE